MVLFKKYCKDCGKLFRPKGRWVKYCPECNKRRVLERNERSRQARRKQSEERLKSMLKLKIAQ